MDSQMANSGPSHLLSIPLEVLLQITSNLTTVEYGNLRRTCKHVEATLFPAFAKEFFTKRQFMFSEFSLQALVDISKSRLGASLNHVIFGLERVSLRHFVNSHILSSLPSDTAAKNDRILQNYVSHMNLLNTGRDVEMIAEALSNLNLETIGMRDFYSRSRYRDHPQVEWKSYGVTTYLTETGKPLSMPQRIYNQELFFPDTLDQANYINRTFLSILRALGKAESRPIRFEVILRSTGLYDHTFNIPKYAEPTVDPVLATLRTLFLDLISGFPDTQVDNNGTPTGCPSYFLKKFLSKVPQLEHLRLNFRKYQNPDTNNVLSWLSEPVSIANSVITPGASLLTSPPPVDFTALRELDIGMITVEPKVLLAIVRKHRTTLRSISFHKVSLLQPDLVKSEPRINLWAKLFEQLSKLDLHLDAMNMSWLSQEQAGRQHIRPIIFKESRIQEVKKWAGTDTQSGLRDFVSLTVIGGEEHDTDSSHSESREDDSMEDEAEAEISDADDED